VRRVRIAKALIEADRVVQQLMAADEMLQRDGQDALVHAGVIARIDQAEAALDTLERLIASLR